MRYLAMAAVAASWAGVVALWWLGALDGGSTLFLLLAVGLVTVCGGASVVFGVITRRSRRPDEQRETVVMRRREGP